MQQKNHAIEFLRTVFTVYIVLRHVLVAVGIQNYLWLGVEFFFVLSGFFLALGVQKNGGNAGTFVVGRYFRFMPLALWGCCLCVTVHPAGILDFVDNALLLSSTGFLTGSGRAINAPTWYLSVLLWGGLLYYVAFKTLGRRAWFLVALTVMVLIPYLRRYGYVLETSVPIKFIPHRFIRGLAELGIGCVAAGVYLNWNRPLGVRWRLLVTLGECAVLLVCVVSPFFGIFRNTGYVTLLLLFDLCLVVLFMKREGALSRALDRPFFSMLSKYSFSVFTTHFFWIFVLRRWVSGHQEAVATSLGQFSVVVVVVVLSVVLGVVSHHLIEIPVARSIRRMSMLGDDFSKENEGTRPSDGVVS